MGYIYLAICTYFIFLYTSVFLLFLYEFLSIVSNDEIKIFNQSIIPGVNKSILNWKYLINTMKMLQRNKINDFPKDGIHVHENMVNIEGMLNLTVMFYSAHLGLQYVQSNEPAGNRRRINQGPLLKIFPLPEWERQVVNSFWLCLRWRTPIYSKLITSVRGSILLRCSYALNLLGPVQYACDRIGSSFLNSWKLLIGIYCQVNMSIMEYENVNIR